MCSFDEDLMSCKCWPSDGFGNNRAIGGAGEGFKCDRHCNELFCAFRLSKYADLPAILQTKMLDLRKA
jgi:hypothetical protein